MCTSFITFFSQSNTKKQRVDFFFFSLTIHGLILFFQSNETPLDIAKRLNESSMIKILSNVKWTEQELTNADKRTTQRMSMAVTHRIFNPSCSSSRNFPFKPLEDGGIKLQRIESVDDQSNLPSTDTSTPNYFQSEEKTHLPKSEDFIAIRPRTCSTVDRKAFTKSMSFMSRTRRPTVIEKSETVTNDLQSELENLKRPWTFTRPDWKKASSFPNKNGTL